MSKAPAREGDTEKITINLGPVDLGRIDLLVREGFFSNRADLIRSAIRKELSAHAEPLQAAMTRAKVELGLRRIGRAELEQAHAAGAPLRLRVLGLAVIEEDVTPELARLGLAELQVLGALHASPEVKAALADRLR
jgi:Arc/MetJ-type ribon-helix-helix transcriptional regulator